MESKTHPSQAARCGSPKPPEDPRSSLAAFTVPGAARTIWNTIEARLEEPGVQHATARFGQRLVEKERCGYVRPTVVHCDSPEPAQANTDDVQLFATDDVVVFQDAGIVKVPLGDSVGNFVAHVSDVVTSTDVTVIATFKSFFPGPAKTITLHLIPGPPK